MASTDEKLLKEIRDNYDVDTTAWKTIRDAGDEDVRIAAEGPWSAEERESRRKANRPCLVMDELGQYVNQAINNLRANKRAIKLTPKRSGVDEEAAEVRQGLVLAIQYKSHAQMAYTTAFQGALERGYGFFRITRDWEADDSFDQELVVQRVADQNSVIPPADGRDPAGRDWKRCFVLEDMSHDEFRRRFKGAKIQSFSADLQMDSPKWLGDDRVQVAEYWVVKYKERTLLRMEGTGAKAFLDELEEVDPGVAYDAKGQTLTLAGQTVRVEMARQVQWPRVMQYLTNGIEILETNEWPGKHIPIVMMAGRERWVTIGSKTERRLESLARKAADAFMLYCYARTGQAELTKMAPKTPWIGYKGQFHSAEWETAHDSPVAYLEVNATTEESPSQPLPLPQRNVFEPPIQALEMLAMAAKQSIQSAIGMYNTSVGRHDTNVKSGRAIEKLDQQSQQGNFHFIDNADYALQYAGEILDENLSSVYRSAREVTVRKPDDSFEVTQIAPQVDEQGQEVKPAFEDQGFDVTISVGPSSETQREQAKDFVEALLPTPFAPLVADLIVKLQGLGAEGDEMVKRLKPPQFAEGAPPPEVAAKMDEMGKVIDELTKQLNMAKEAMAAKDQELVSKERIADADRESKEDIAALQATVDLIGVNAKAQIEDMKQQMAAAQMQISALQQRESGDREDRRMEMSQAEAADAGYAAS